MVTSSPLIIPYLDVVPVSNMPNMAIIEGMYSNLDALPGKKSPLLHMCIQ
jgi:hypothetical protein